MQINGDILSTSFLNVENFQRELLPTVALRMREKIVRPGETIFERGERDERLYFVRAGVIQLVTELNGSKRVVKEFEVIKI